jgi:hypothetical protein
LDEKLDLDHSIFGGGGERTRRDAGDKQCSPEPMDSHH